MLVSAHTFCALLAGGFLVFWQFDGKHIFRIAVRLTVLVVVCPLISEVSHAFNATHI